MNKLTLYTTLLVLYCAASAYGQTRESSYLDADFRSLEVKLGKNGILQIPAVPNINVLYQQNLGRGIGAAFYSELALSVFDTDPSENYLTINHFRMVEALGVGGSIGNKGFNNSLFFLGGMRYYRSHSYAQEALKPELITSKLLPELGVLYRLRLGQKKIYFTLQHYLSLYPFRMLAAGEGFSTTSVGLGIKLKNGHKSK